MAMPVYKPQEQQSSLKAIMPMAGAAIGGPVGGMVGGMLAGGGAAGAAQGYMQGAAQSRADAMARRLAEMESARNPFLDLGPGVKSEVVESLNPAMQRRLNGLQPMGIA